MSLSRDDILDLMQPGGTTWRDEASCLGDKRFTVRPDSESARRLSLICNSCPVLLECSSWARNQTDVFAAGRWR